MASGIVVRTIAPLLVSKASDPAVVVMDSRGAFAVSLLSGHLGGANDLAKALAKTSGGQAVITTGTDVEHTLAFDVFARENHLRIVNLSVLKYISGGHDTQRSNRPFGVPGRYMSLSLKMSSRHIKRVKCSRKKRGCVLPMTMMCRKS